METYKHPSEMIEIIKHYNRSLVSLASKLSSLLGIEDLTHWRAAGALRVNDFPEEKMSYYFHGSGCLITTPTLEIDFDFDLDCSIGGFDAWRIWRFIDNNENIASAHPSLITHRQVRDSFELLIKEGIIYQKHPGTLYWLKSSNA